MEGTPTVVNEGALDLIDLPPGFRFHPTDEEIITHYLTEKVMNNSFSARAIGEVDLNKCEPWDLPKKAKMGEKEWFFFCKRDRKYPTGMRTNRATESGYWKATGKDKEIYKQQLQGTGNSQLVGMKKTLVFYKGRAPKGAKTNWVMHEFRLEEKFSYYNFPKAPKEDWVVCRVFHKNTGLIKRSPFTTDPLMRINYYYSFVDDDLLDSPSLPPLMDPRPNYSHNNDRQTGSSSFTINGEEDEYKRTTATDSLSDHGNYLSYFSESPQTQEEEEEADHKSFLITPNNYATYQAAAAAASPSNQMPPNSSFYSQIALPNNNNGSAGFMIRMGNIEPAAVAKLRAVATGNYLQGRSDDEVERKQYCKVEQLSSYKSNQSVVSRLSQDTDMTTEISSSSAVVSKQDMGMGMGMAAGRSNPEDLDVDEEGPSLLGPPLDLDSLWNC